MKKLVTSYTFDASAKTVVSADFSSLEGILLITNVTDNVIIYNFAGASKGGALSGTTLTLDFDTTTMDDSDSLQIFIEDSSVASTEEGQTEMSSLIETLNGLNARLTVLASMANAGAPALRTIPIASVSTAVTGTLTAVTTVGTITNFGTSIPASEMAHDMNNMTAVLANINNVSITA